MTIKDATPQRIALALAACVGLPDKDLAKRGPLAFPKMILRKRGYAAAARKLAAENVALKAALAKAEATIASYQELEALDALGVSDTTQAQQLLAGITGKKAD